MRRFMRVLALVAVSVLAVTMSACEVKKTKEVEMPEVKDEGGQIPESEVETMAPSVEAESETPPAELEMAPSVEPESETPPGESHTPPSVE